MRVVVFLAVLMFVLRGCASDKGFDDAPDAAQNNTPVQDGLIQSDLDPFVTGSSYRFVLRFPDIVPGLTKSSAAVRIAIRGRGNSPNPEDEDTTEDTETEDTETEETETEDTETEDTEDDADNEDDEDEPDTDIDLNDSSTLAADAKVRLDWVCGEDQQRGHKKVEMRNLDATLDVALTELPPLKRASASIKCEVEAALDTTRTDGERVIATGSGEFYIEMDVLYPAMKLHDLEITEDTSDASKSKSLVDFTVTLIRQGKVVAQGDPIFDEEVEVDLTWICNDAPEADSRSKSQLATELSIPAGKAAATAQLKLPNTRVGEGGYACMIEASTDIDGYEQLVKGSKKLWIEGKDLQVAVTAVSSTSLSYTVMQRYKKFDGNVKLSIESCEGVGLGSGDNAVASSGVVTGVSGTGTGCMLKAQVVSSDGSTVLREGVSKAFAVPSALQ